VHDAHRERVGAFFIGARVSRAEHRTTRHQHGAGSGHIAEHQADQKRRTAVTNYPAQPVAMGDVAKFVRQDAGELVRRLRYGEQLREHINPPAR
jgi:hypothetical protein